MSTAIADTGSGSGGSLRAEGGRVRTGMRRRIAGVSLRIRLVFAVLALARISTQRLRPSCSGEFEVEAAVVPPGDGGVRGQVGLAQDG